MGDGPDLTAVQRRPRGQGQQHRRGGLVLRGGEHVLLRDREVHDRGLHTVDRLQRLVQLGLQPARVGHVLLQVGRGHALAVEHRVAAVAVVHQALAGHRHPQVVHLGLRHQDRRAAVAELVLHVVGLQLLDDRVGVGAGQVAEQRRPGRLGDPLGEEDRAQHQAEEGHDDDAGLPRGEALREGAHPAERLRHPRGHSGILMISLKASRALFRTVVVSSVEVWASIAVMT